MSNHPQDLLAILGGTPAVPHPLPWTTPVGPDEIDAVTRAMQSCPLTDLFGGYEVATLEAEFAAVMSADHAVAVSSGTGALHLALVAAGVGPGDEVVVTPYSFVASVSVVVQVGATPVFADIDSETLGLSVTSVQRALTSRTRAVIPVHVSGAPIDVEELCEMLPDHVKVIEDCAACHGARVRGRRVGTIGDFGCFSFNVGKVIRTGEGGMILAKHGEQAAILREMRVNGMAPRGGVNHVVRMGFNYTMAQPLAAMARVQVARLDELRAQREVRAAILERAVEGLPVTTLPARPGFERTAYAVPFWLSADHVHLRDRVVQALRSENVPTRANCTRPLYEVHYIRALVGPIHLSVADLACRSTFDIDPLPAWSLDDTRRVGAGLRKVLSQLSKLETDPG